MKGIMEERRANIQHKQKERERERGGGGERERRMEKDEEITQIRGVKRTREN